ncbi:MAG: IS110 family transposase, partial [Bifidobacteriaceae bacterium]|nr:IS110 family transposase [Bifidobacteriaceae bacterium]
GKARAAMEVTTWGARSSQILELGGHLAAKGVTLAVMEATGDYWKPWFHLLRESGLEVMLVNARQARQIPGRKTDVNDCVWLADLAAHGLLRGSFVPAAPVGELKDLARERTVLTKMRGQEAQRLEKVLESAAVKLSCELTDIMGASGRAMVEALIAGERDPKRLARLARPNVKSSPDDLAEALTGRFTDHHAFMAKVHLDVVDHLSAKIAEVDARIDAYFDAAGPGAAGGSADPSERAGLAEARELLDTIPGVSEHVAEVILAEVGPDVSAFPDAAHLASWAGVAPGSNESAGRVKSAKCRKGDTHLKGALGVAALAITRCKPCYLQAFYKRVRSSRGHMKALVAVERKIIEAAWHILSKREPYKEPGADFYAKRRPGNAARKAVQQLKAAGYDVAIGSDGTIAAQPTPA